MVGTIFDIVTPDLWEDSIEFQWIILVVKGGIGII